MEKIEIQQFIVTYQQLADRYEEIRKLFSPNLYPMDSIEIEDGKISFKCSESFRGSMDYETYTFSEEELNRSNEEWIEVIAENKRQAAIQEQQNKEILEQQKKDQRRHQFEQLQKEFRS